MRYWIWLCVSVEAYACELAWQDYVKYPLIVMLLSMGVQAWAIQSTEWEGKAGESTRARRRATGRTSKALKRTHKRWIGEMQGGRIGWGWKTCGDDDCEFCRKLLREGEMRYAIDDVRRRIRSIEENL